MESRPRWDAGENPYRHELHGAYWKHLRIAVDVSQPLNGPELIRANHAESENIRVIAHNRLDAARVAEQ